LSINDITNEAFRFAVAKNGTADSNMEVKFNNATTTSILTPVCYPCGIVQLATNDYVYVSGRTGANNYSVKIFDISIRLVGVS
jgi:hypothetical protein